MPRTYVSRNELLQQNKELKAELESLKDKNLRLQELIDKNKSRGREAQAEGRRLHFKLGTHKS